MLSMQPHDATTVVGWVWSGGSYSGLQPTWNTHKNKGKIGKQTTTPQVHHDPWCALLLSLPSLIFFCLLNVPSELKSTTSQKT